jgi:putative nucleotidyltransferase with HDIG domain
MAELVIDAAKIKKAAHNAIPLTITTYTLPHEIELYMEEVLDVFLTEIGQKKLKDYLIYCLRELAVNAKKANTKRVYFEELELDINDADEYERGMQSFKQVTLDNIEHYLSLQKEQGLYIKLLFQAKGQSILLEVRNNVEINKKEYIRIHDKLARARTYGSLEEVMGQVVDSTEGAGLGLVILILMLKKIGLSEDCFDIFAEKGETVARITIPVNATKVENLSLLSDELVRQINTLPQFPENVSLVQRLISDPKSQMVDIAKKIAMDPSMTAELLRMVNSAQFMLSKRVDNIPEAVKLVGLRGIKSLLYSYGTQRILGADDTDEKRELWNHSYRTAFYAYNLVRNFKPQNKELLDDVYVGGMLHDMGKIVFSSVHPELLDHIREFCGRKNIPNQLFEELSAGMNHAEIGARIAEKWNFPETLVTSIRFHHEPSLATDHQSVVNAVYLANAMTCFENNEIAFEQIEAKALLEFGITNQNQLKKITNQFNSGFRMELK